MTTERYEPPDFAYKSPEQLINEGYVQPSTPPADPLAELDALLAALPDSGKLLALADWFDAYDTERGFTGDAEVQRDLRAWGYAAIKAREIVARLRGATP